MKNLGVKKSRLWDSLLHYNLYFFPAIFILGFLIALTETYKYKGFFEKHFYIQIDLIYSLSILSGILIMFSLNKLLNSDLKWKLNQFYSVILKYSVYLFITFVFLSMYFNGLEARKGLNYIFSTYHIQPGNAAYLFGLVWLTLLISLLSKINLKSSED